MTAAQSRQTNGFLLVERPMFVHRRYEQNPFARKNRQHLAGLRAALSFVNPCQYRGIDRFPLDPLPSLDPDTIEAFEGGGIDLSRNYRAAHRLREIIGEDTPETDFNENMLPDTELAREIRTLVDDPARFEIIGVAREPFPDSGHRLGFEPVESWSKLCSLIRESAIWPFWHPPDPEFFPELAERLRGLNQYALFDTEREAREFLEYSLTRSWKHEAKWREDFDVVQVSAATPVVSAQRDGAEE